MWILLFLWNIHLGEWNLDVLVKIPVFSVYGVRVVRVSKGHCQTKRPCRRGAASGGVEVSGRFEHDFLVEVELI